MITLQDRDRSPKVGISSGNQTLTRCAFIRTNPEEGDSEDERAEDTTVHLMDKTARRQMQVIQRNLIGRESAPLLRGEGLYRTGDSVALAARIHRLHGVVVGRIRWEVVQ